MEDKILYGQKIGEMTNLGAGIVRADDGRVIFVNGGVTGDICDVRITSERRSYLTGEIAALNSPSDMRIRPDCGAFCLGCGGCTFRHISYEHELMIKQSFIESLFRKAHLDVNIEPIRTAGESAPRTKVTVPVSENYELGYYKNNSHTVMPCLDCRLHDENTNRILSEISSLAKTEKPIGLHHITIRRGSGGTMLIFTSSKDSDKDFTAHSAAILMQNFDEIKSVYFNLCEKDSVRGKYTLISGDSRISDTLTGCEFLISPDAFYQVNHGGAEILYTLAKDFAELKDGDSVADLYCGTGTIGLSVIKNSSVNAELFGIEIVKSAVEDAKLNAKINGIDAEFISADAAVYDSNADVVIVDPPRAGCSQKLLTHLTNTLPRRIVYISCDPATLVRDCKILSQKYSIERVVPVDMFPRTSHCECAVLLIQKDIVK